jgi:hypothetical protein
VTARDTVRVVVRRALDQRRVAILADRLARLESGWAWLDAQEGVVRDPDGELFPVAERLEKWAVVAELRLAEAEEKPLEAAGLSE